MKQEKMQKAGDVLVQLGDTKDDYGPNDIYSQVMGEDKGSYVRGYGLGPSPKDLWGLKETKLM